MSADNESKQTIEVDVNDQTLSFTLGVSDYNRYINQMNQQNKVQPSHNFCVQTVDKENKKALQAILKTPGAGLQIASAIIEEFSPEINIVAKKRTATE